MSIKSGVLAAVTSLVLMLALGNEWVVERAFDGDLAVQTRSSVTGSLRWQIWELPSGMRGAVAGHLVALVVLTFVLGGIAGRSRGLTAFLGGWAAFLAASVVSLGIYGLIIDDDFIDQGTDVIDQFTGSAGFGAPLGMWLGWLIGLAVLIGSKAPASAAAGAAPPAPPPPSWPPSSGQDPVPFTAPPTPYSPTGPQAAGPAPEPAPAAPPPFAEAPPTAAPPSPGGPVIGPPPDRTQVYPPNQP
jgi:hypothetical protein